MRPRKFVRSTALVLVLTAALTVTAFAADPTQQPATKTENKSSYYPTSVEMTEDDAGNPMIRKTYQLSVSDDPQKLPVADFERDGRRYYLLAASPCSPSRRRSTRWGWRSRRRCR